MVGSFLEGRGSFQNILVLVNLQECIVAGGFPSASAMLATLETNEKQKRSGSVVILPGLPHACIRALPSNRHTFSEPRGLQDAVYTKMNKGVCDEQTTSNFKDKEKKPNLRPRRKGHL